MGEYDSNNGFVPQERPQKLDPVASVSQENADLVVKGCNQLFYCTVKWKKDVDSLFVTDYWERIWYFNIFFNMLWLAAIECFHMTSRRPYWCSKTMKRRPCWCPKPSLRELNSFLMQTLSFVPINLQICWPRERKYSISTQHSPFKRFVRECNVTAKYCPYFSK